MKITGGFDIRIEQSEAEHRPRPVLEEPGTCRIWQHRRPESGSMSGLSRPVGIKVERPFVRALLLHGMHPAPHQPVSRV